MKGYLENCNYDYLIVGAGPAGCVLAKELSNDRKNSVLLIEAGENHDDDPIIRDSSDHPNLFHNKYFWQGKSSPLWNANMQKFDWSTGRLLGGGSSVNGEQYVRPTPYVLDKWENVGGSIWGPEAVNRSFSKIEKFYGKTNNPYIHGSRGELAVSQVPNLVPVMTQKLVAAIEQGTGFKTIVDYNDPNTPIGPFLRWQLTQYPNSERASASTAFLGRDVVDINGNGLNGRKLKVLYKTTAMRIIINDKNEAIGVEYLKEGKCEIIFARKNVILSSGINTTQLLMLSGIGPYEDLKESRIPMLVHNKNIGISFANHPANMARFIINSMDIQGVLNAMDAKYYGGAFLPSPFDYNSRERSVQLIGMYSNGFLNLMVVILSPKSRGTIKLQNNDPLTIVDANYNYLDDPRDLELIKNIFKTYIKNISLCLADIDHNYKLISPSIDIIDNDEMLEDFIKENLSNTYHQQSSVPMGFYNDGGAADYLGRVYGTKNLIVADCSLIPYTVDGNTQAPAYLIGYTIAKELLRQ